MAETDIAKLVRGIVKEKGIRFRPCEISSSGKANGSRVVVERKWNAYKGILEIEICEDYASKSPSEFTPRKIAQDADFLTLAITLDDNTGDHVGNILSIEYPADVEQDLVQEGYDYELNRTGMPSVTITKDMALNEFRLILGDYLHNN